MDDKAFDQCEVTLFFEKVKYRTASGAEREGFRFKKNAQFRYNEFGQERDFVSSINIVCDAFLESQTHAFKDAIFLLETAPVDQADSLHVEGGI